MKKNSIELVKINLKKIRTEKNQRMKCELKDQMISRFKELRLIEDIINGEVKWSTHAYDNFLIRVSIHLLEPFRKKHLPYKYIAEAYNELGIKSIDSVDISANAIILRYHRYIIAKEIDKDRASEKYKITSPDVDNIQII